MSRDINNKFWDEELETLPREELEKRQLADLQEIVKFAYENAPYYKRSFDEAGVKPEDIKTLKDIQKFPFINKKTQRDTQGVGSFLGELAAVPEEDVVFISTSSGSTGVPTMSPFFRTPKAAGSGRSVCVQTTAMFMRSTSRCTSAVPTLSVRRISEHFAFGAARCPANDSCSS